MKMKSIKLLDCTLRDGGYVNDWNFGHSAITGIYKRLDEAGVDYIEVGFLDDRRGVDINRTIQPNTDCYNKLFENVEKKHAIPVAMIDFGTCDISNIGMCDSTFIDGIRVIFKKDKIEEALPFCEEIKKKGYKLFIQAISITSYSDIEMLEYIKKINVIKPYAFSIVDTYGLLNSRKLTNYFNLMNNNLDPEIKIGYHAHNNFQLAFSNSIKFLALETSRELVVDATVYGMGKSAGNAASELVGMHMNNRYNKHYDISQFLEIIDTELMPIYQRRYWGYKYNFYISALHNCHPNYVMNLLERKTLSMTSINEILSKIPEEIKLTYDSDYIEDAYIEYQCKSIDGQNDIKHLSEELNGQSILLLGPGKSIIDEENKIKDVIKKENSVVVSVNFQPDVYKCNYIFVSNAKRYSKLVDDNSDLSNVKLIVTSNVTTYARIADYVVNYSELLSNGRSDNALLLVVAALINMGVSKVNLAGFDGFRVGEEDYYNRKYIFSGNEKYKLSSNEITLMGLKELSKKININFITESLYDWRVERD